MTAGTDHQRGLELARSGRLTEAETIFRGILEADPSDAEAHRFFGVLSARRNEPTQAERHFRQALASRPGWAEAWNGLGAVLQMQGQLEAALAACEESIRLDPQSDEALFNLGLVYRALGRPQDAAEAVRKAVGANPDFADAYSLLAAVLSDMSRDEESAAAARRAIDLAPEHAEAHNNLGTALRRLGRPAEAEAAYRRAIGIEPGTGVFHGNLANLLRARGALAEAETEWHHAVELDPAHTDPYRMLAESGSIEVDDPLFARMEARLRSDATTPAGRIDLHFAMARVFENQAAYDSAFDHWEAGNRLKRSMIDYDDAVRETAVENIMAVFNEELLDRYAGGGCTSDSSIFVLGMPRSGTTLVEQILASHSQVQAGGELKLLRRLARQARYPEAFADPAPPDPKRLGEAYLAAARSLGGPYFTDKMPDNYLRIGLIRLALPNARIIHCRRDPVDTCLSCYQHLFVRGSQEFSYDLRELGLEYRRYARLMAHWRMLAPGAIHDLQYESLIVDQEGETRRLLEFCGLPFENACLRFHETERTIDTASAHQVRQRIYQGAAQRWTRYEKHLGPLLEALRPESLP